MRTLVTLVIAASLCGCSLITGNDDELVCHDSGGGPAIEVVVTDSVTGEFMAANAGGHIQRGSFREDLVQAPQFLANERLMAWGNGPREYDVRVEAEGYHSWSQTAVGVGADECGAILSTRLNAKLQPKYTGTEVR